MEPLTHLSYDARSSYSNQRDDLELLGRNTLSTTEISSLEKIYSGKVRDIYAINDELLLMLASDRLSAFDVILPTPIPGKGEILTSVSNFWFNMFAELLPNHLTEHTADEFITNDQELEYAQQRSVIVKRLKPLPVEAIVRGYLIGSGWKDYQQHGSVCGVSLPTDLLLADKLPDVIYTPSTKAAVGNHDINIDYDETVKLVGVDLATQIKQASVEIYTRAAEYALQRGIIIADTKFEFGLDDSGVLHLMDEVLTPDSSRFWPVDQYQPGTSPFSFDKQFIRDYLETLGWNKQPPGPEIPPEIIEKTRQNYTRAVELLTH